MTGAEFRQRLEERFPIRDDSVHEEPFWWDLLGRVAETEFNRAYQEAYPRPRSRS